MTLILVKPNKNKKGILIIKVTEIQQFTNIIEKIINIFHIGISYNIGLLNLDIVPEWCEFIASEGGFTGKPKKNIKFYTDIFATRNFNQKFFCYKIPKINESINVLLKLNNLNHNKIKYNINHLINNYDKKKGKLFDLVYISRAQPKRNIPLLIQAYSYAFLKNPNIKICIIHTEHKCRKNYRNINLQKIYNNLPNNLKKNLYYYYIKDNGTNNNSNGSGMFENNGLNQQEISIFLNLSKTYYFGEQIEISKKYGANRTICQALCCGLKIVCFKYDKKNFSCSHKYINNNNSYQFTNLKDLIDILIKINLNKFDKIEDILELREEYTIKKLKEYIKKYFNNDSEFNKEDNLKYRITCHSRDEAWYHEKLDGGTSAIKTQEQINIFLNEIKDYL